MSMWMILRVMGVRAVWSASWYADPPNGTTGTPRLHSVPGKCGEANMKSGRVDVGLLNPKSPANVGAVLRAVGCFEGDGVFFTGTRFARASRYHTDTRRVGDAMTPQHVDSLVAARGDSALVCVEWVEGATALPDFVHPSQAFYAFGPEDGTLDQALIDQADAVVYVPTTGCLNLAASGIPARWV